MVKNLPGNAGDWSSIPRWRKFPGGGNDNPLQYSCLGNAMDRGAWWVGYSLWDRKESDTTGLLNNSNNNNNKCPNPFEIITLK